MHEGGTKDPRFIIRTTFAPDPKMLEIEIEDNGPGIEEDNLKRVFEPFFTTKPLGEGTGLGLSVSYFIIKVTHHGEMLVDSTPGEGTKFLIHIPFERRQS
ncbi:MAG: hypothetical protein JEZ06_06230 [Anaerolineaceae bacterium]|nr:hypothetical protein [Anaerolineaceae bacterium]